MHLYFWCDLWYLHSNAGHALRKQPLLSTSGRSFFYMWFKYSYLQKYLFTLLSSHFSWPISLLQTVYSGCLLSSTGSTLSTSYCSFFSGASCYIDSVRNCWNAPSSCEFTGTRIPFTVPEMFLTQKKAILHEMWGLKHQHALENTGN